MRPKLRPRRPTLVVALLLFVGLVTLITTLAYLNISKELPPQNLDIAQPTASLTSASGPLITSTGSLPAPTGTALPALLGDVTPTPILYEPVATTTARVINSKNRTRRIRCDNPNYWSLPVIDHQYRFSALFGLQPVGSVYYNGLVQLKLITPWPTPSPTATMPPNTTATPTATPTLTPTFSGISNTVAITLTPTLTPGVMHPGVDIPLDEDTPIYAVAGGEISSVSYSDVYGLHIILNVKGYQVLYGHLNENLVEEGQRVNCGQLIGRSGATGTYQTGPHLHFEVRKQGVAIDPIPLLQQTLRASLPSDLKAQMDIQEKFSKKP